MASGTSIQTLNFGNTVENEENIWTKTKTLISFSLFGQWKQREDALTIVVHMEVLFALHPLWNKGVTWWDFLSDQHSECDGGGGKPTSTVACMVQFPRGGISESWKSWDTTPSSPSSDSHCLSRFSLGSWIREEEESSCTLYLCH